MSEDLDENESVNTNTETTCPLIRSNSAKFSSSSSLGSSKKKVRRNKKLSISIANALNKDTHNFVAPYLLSYSKDDPNVVKWKSLGDCQPHPDISAMSVISLYQKGDTLDEDMDTNQDLSESPTPTSPKIFVNAPNLKMASEEDLSAFPNCNCNPDSSLKRSDKRNACLIRCPKQNIYFNDGKRSVDFVIVWDGLDVQALTETNKKRREIFEKNLAKEGLELEFEEPEKNGLHFIKIHVPKEVLRRYSEILKLRMPMKEELCKLPKELRYNRLHSAAAYLKEKLPGLRTMHQSTNFLIEGINSQWQRIKEWILVDKEKFPEKGQRFTAIYSRDREYLFDIDSPCFFTPAIRSRIVHFILDRKRFSLKDSDDFGFGIEKLLNEKAYTAAYPLHDGDLRQPGSMRHLLYTEWTTIRKWYRYQPLDYVKEYFGVKIALYFAWLGFYTHMLIPASIVGLLCFGYSWSTLYTNQPSEDICNSNIKMCPLCDHWCDYWNLNETCVHARITYLFDNATTVFFAIFMSFWATLFLELWKRYSAEITHRWDLTGFDIQEEHPRPQYLARLSHIKKTEVNVITNTIEPHVPFWRMKVPATIFSFSVVLLLVALAVATVVAVVLYRMSVLTALHFYGKKGVPTSYAILFTTSTAACINLICIVIFNWIYTYLAEYLTELELLRTQTEFDDSLTLKIYLLQFVNYYASIFYIAFFKGKFIGTPQKYNRVFGFRQEECGPGGCLMELCIQLAIIMVGKQAVNTILEMLFPLFFKWLNTLKVKTGLQKGTDSVKGQQRQWVKDFKLVDWGPRSLFPEYLEMVLQYGFVTIFVAAFPLAPFFALLNNVLEMRLDAQKLLTFYRRPVTQRVRDIGIWYRILDSIGKLSVVTNGFIIAFTSNFIPKLVYRIDNIAGDHSLRGYLNHSLSYFNTSQFGNGSTPENSAYNYSTCRYPDYREPYWSEKKYEHSSVFWHILAARLAFVVVFENVVAFVMIMVKWCIPDVPGHLRNRIRREAYITNEIIIKQEALRANSAQGDSLQVPVRKLRTYDVSDCPTTPEQWDQLLNKSLSGSEFDLVVHHSNTFAPNDRTNSQNSGQLKSPTSV